MGHRDVKSHSFNSKPFRLSEMMGKQMKNNNPVITDLNDPDRPLRIVEKFSNVFENEWTDTIDEIELVTGNEIAAIKILRSVVIVSITILITPVYTWDIFQQSIQKKMFLIEHLFVLSLV